MHLKSLTLHGFKSFAEKTTIEFDRGVTGIVGPNGCGKSNVVDAIRWVLGETSAKALRGGEMADVIFNGAEKRKPLGMAEVTLLLADCQESLKTDYEEVAITRRVYRDGKSEYRLNGTLCRLRDINDLFMDTGIGRSSYSIMEQGKIDLLLSSKPEDRRSVFEEAAGITKSKKEKKDALRKLEYTEANLLRVSDVLEEQSRRIRSLKRQVSKARRYQKLHRDWRLLDTHASHQQFLDLRAAHQELTISRASLTRQVEEQEGEMETCASQVEEARQRESQLAARLAEMTKELSDLDHQQQRLEGLIAHSEERERDLTERLGQYQQEITEARQHRQQNEESLEAARARLALHTSQLATRKNDLSSAQSAEAEARQQRRQLEDQLRTSRVALSKLREERSALRTRLETARAQREHQRQRRQELESERQGLAEEHEHKKHLAQQSYLALTQHQEREPELRRELEEVAEALKVREAALRERRAQVNDCQSRHSRQQSRLEILVAHLESGEGMGDAAQALFQTARKKWDQAPEVLGTVLQVSSQHAPVLQALLGPALEAFLCPNPGEARELLQQFFQEEKGRATLLTSPFEVPRSSTDFSLAEGQQWLLDLVEAPPSHRDILHSLLSGVVLVESLEAAFALLQKHPQLVAVTAHGEILRPDGTVTGGQGTESTSLLERQNERRALEKEVAELEGELEAARAGQQQLEEQIAETRQQHEELRQALHQHEIESATFLSKSHLTQQAVETLEKRLESLAREEGNLTQSLEAAGAEEEQLQGQLEEGSSQDQGLEQDLERLEGQLCEAEGHLQERAGQLSEVRTALAVEEQAHRNANDAQRPLTARIGELDVLVARREEEVRRAQEKMSGGEQERTEARAELEQLVGQREEQATRLEDERQAQPALHRAFTEARERQHHLREALEKARQQLGKEEVESTKLELRLENLQQGFVERHNVELEGFEPQVHELLGTYRRVREGGGESDPESAESALAETEEGGEPVAATGWPEGGEPDWEEVATLARDLKRKLENLGVVNLDAIGEYEELEERHAYTTQQHDDLVSSKEQLLDIIERINRESERLFRETFKAVSVNFRSMFKELFGPKGQASLTLTDEDDPLECGIEVEARPPGKKLQSISLLSGGERSMTAVALLFSIYMVKPSPFCVLDELDAPLDESNIGRFLKVLDRFIEQSQFIIVTHSKRTMQRADVMYGVTMEEYGVSKPVGMRLTREEKDLEAQPKGAASRAALRLDA